MDVAKSLSERDCYLLVGDCPELKYNHPNYKPQWLRAIKTACRQPKRWSCEQSFFHHKFMVFCKYNSNQQFNIVPYGIWLGSPNFTEQSVYNQENGLYLQDYAIAQVYYQNFLNLWQISRYI